MTKAKTISLAQTNLALNDSSEELQHSTAYKAVYITDMGLQHGQELVPSTTGSFLQLVTVQHLHQHFCHSCQNGISHHVTLKKKSC